MEFNDYYLDVDLKLPYEDREIIINKGDSLLTRLKITLRDNNKLFNFGDLTVKIHFAKPDNTVVLQDEATGITKDINASTIDCVLNTQTIAAAGRVMARVALYGTNNERITSKIFWFSVEDSMQTDGAIESSNEFSALTLALSQIENLDSRFDTINSALNDIVSQANDLETNKADKTALNATNAEVSLKANKNEVTNVLTPKGNIAYASLPTTGNTVGWYYYCSDGDGTHGKGNYVWNGTTWYFGGTGDEGYNTLKKDLDYTNGFNLLTINTVGNETKFITYPLVKNRKYLVTNNTTDNITVNLYAAYVKLQTVSTGLAAGASIEFMCNVDGATQIGGWINLPGTITIETVTTLKSINNKVDKIDGKALSTNDYTNAEKNKLSSISMQKNSLNNGIDLSLNGITNTLATKIDLDNSVNLNVIEATYKDGYYLLQNGSESAGSGNKLGTILGVKYGGILFYSGAGYWSEVCGYYADGTVIKLLDENNVRTNYKIRITDEKIVAVKAWSITNTKELSLKYYSPIFDKAKKPYIIVDVNGNGDFTDIQSAINFANYFYNTKTESVTIYIRNGIYNVVGTGTDPYYAIDKGSNRINLLGESRDGVIIRCTCTDTIQGIALNIGGQCTIENITIEELIGAGYNAGTHIGTHKNYALHNDTPAQDSTEPYYTTVKNCKLYSECNTPIGAGLQNNQTQRYENVECIYAENAVVKQQGSLYVHAPYSSNFIANGLEVVNCTLVSYNERPAMSLGNVSGTQPYSDIPQTYIRNVTASAGVNEVVCDGFNKAIISKGNSNSLLNY